MPHSIFSPSAAHRWIACPGSFAYPGNTEDSESSEYADDGTASHHWAAKALSAGVDAEFYLGLKQVINGRTYTMDEERADFIQVYIDACRQLGFGKLHFVEHWVDTSEWLGEGQGGTVDFGVIDPDIITVADLKYGMGEKVEAFYTLPDGTVVPNEQLGIYAAGLLRDAQLLGYTPTHARLMVVQPRLGHISEYTFDVIDILALMQRAKSAAAKAITALVSTPEKAALDGLMNPGEKTCRWCQAKAECPKLYTWTQDQVRADFEELREPKDIAPVSDLSAAMRSVPLVRLWCDAVEASAIEHVQNGEQVIGSDGQPMKFVEGKLGKRRWAADPGQVEAALVGQLGDKAYEPRKVITAPAAGKLLDRKKTKNLWTDIFAPMITRSPGRPMLALGSDPRPVFTGSADAVEFEETEE
jgi:hypothetical protein